MRMSARRAESPSLAGPRMHRRELRDHAAGRQSTGRTAAPRSVVGPNSNALRSWMTAVLGGVRRLGIAPATGSWRGPPRMVVGAIIASAEGMYLGRRGHRGRGEAGRRLRSRGTSNMRVKGAPAAPVGGPPPPAVAAMLPGMRSGAGAGSRRVARPASLGNIHAAGPILTNPAAVRSPATS